MDWVVAHSVQILNIVTGVIAVASAISALTPSETDNKVVSKLKSLVDFFALNVLNAKTK